MPLDLFSRLEGALGDLSVPAQDDGWRIELPGDSVLEIAGFPALRLVLAADPVFTVVEAEDCDSVAFRLDEISFDIESSGTRSPPSRT